MEANAVARLFMEVGTWVDWTNTTDGFKIGDPGVEVTGIAVGWKPYWRDLKRAHELGCNLFVSHESVFRDSPMGSVDEHDSASAWEQPKRQWLQETGMLVYRNHDMWDAMPGQGVLDTWARELGFGGPPLDVHAHCQLVDVSGHTFGSLCAQVAARVKEVGQQAVLADGDANRPVTRLALGGWCIPQMLDLGADVFLTYHDYFRYVRDGAFLRDAGVPFIAVDHGAMEEWGIRNLYEFVRAHFPDVPTHFMPQGCCYRLVAG